MEPKSLNSLMAHLRESGVSIGGSSQKRKLKNIGYYHGYKGFRFATHSGNRLPIRSFDQIVLLHSICKSRRFYILKLGSSRLL